MARLLLITIAVLYGTCAFADDDDRSERRELRERREKVRGAIQRMNKCIENRDLAPCMASNDDAETRNAVMFFMLKKKQ